jgi:hypothetical protein
MIIYFILFFIFMFCCSIYVNYSFLSIDSVKFSNKYGFFFLFLPFVFLIFLMGFRYEVGADYWNYIEIFENFKAGDSFALNRFEPGFLAILIGVDLLGLSSGFFLFTFYLFTVSLFWGAIRNVKFGSASMESLAVLLFLGIGPVFSATNTVRQALAVSIVLFFCSFFSRSKILSTTLSSIFGFLFHYSAPIVMALNFVPRKTLSFKFWVFVVIITLIFSNLIMDWLFKTLAQNSYVLADFGAYFESDGASRKSSGLGIRIVFEIALFLFLSSFSKRINPRGVWFFNIAFFGILLTYIFREYAIFLRVSVYFSIFKILAIPWFLHVFKGVEKKIFFLFFIVYSLSAFVRSVMAEQFSPYKLMFFN